MAIWIFGDSFAARKGGTDSYPGWFNIIGTELEQPVINHSVYGASFHYIQSKFLELENDIRDTDTVIFLLTVPRKMYFFKDNPSVSFDWFIDKVNYNQDWLMLPEAKQNAFKAYFEHLHSDELVQNDTKVFLRMLDSIASKFKKVLVIKAFNEYPNVVPSDYKNILVSSGKALMDISSTEVPSDELKKLLLNPDCKDNRNCHLNEQSHQHVAKVIVDALNGQGDLRF